MLYDSLIIGRGPAGLSCAVYTIRANLKTLVVGQHNSALLKADKIENYYGFKDPLSGRELLDAGESQARRLGVEFADDEVVGIEKEDHFKVICTGAVYEARTVLLATGSPPIKAPIKKLEQFEGRGISYCTTCDGFFYRNKKVGVLGFTDYAVHEAFELMPFTQDVTLYTNGMPLKLSDKNREKIRSFKVNQSKIKELIGDEVLSGLSFEDGKSESLQGLFVAFGSASSTSFALKLGIVMEGKSIKVNDRMETNIPGLYAAGDCTGIFKQVSVAVGQGAIASRQMIEAVRKMKTTEK